MNKKIKNVLTVALTAAMCGTGAASVPPQPKKHLLYAHRGESLEAPENSLEAARRALTDGFGVELDLYMTLDGEVYLTHDRSASTMKRKYGIDKISTNCHWKGELEKADAGKWRGKEWAGTPFARLDDVLAIAPAGARFIFDMKDPRPEMVPLIRAAVDRHPQVKDENIIFLGGDMRRLFPKSRLLLCTLPSKGWAADAPAIPREEKLAQLRKSGADGMSVLWRRDIVTADYIKFFNDAGYPVHVWTVNDPVDAALALERGAASVTSDSPRRLLSLWEEAFTDPPAKVPGAFRMMVFNIWGPFFNNPVKDRVAGVETTIRREKPDVVALQETTPEWWASGLMERLSTDYGIIEGGWERQNRHHNPNPLLYRKDLFAVVATGRETFHFPLDYSKGYTWAVFREKATGRTFTAFSTHFWWQENGEESDMLRLWNAEKLVHGLDRVRTAEMIPSPVIGGGDFNARLGSPALEYIFSRGFSDAQLVAKEASSVTSWHGNPVRDWHGDLRGFVPRKNVDASRSLDHVIAGTGIEVLRHRIVRHPAAMDVSDHSPVVVDFRIRQ